MTNYHTAHPVRTVGTALERSSLGTRHHHAARAEGIFAGLLHVEKDGVSQGSAQQQVLMQSNPSTLALRCENERSSIHYH